MTFAALMASRICRPARIKKLSIAGNAIIF